MNIRVLPKLLHILSRTQAWCGVPLVIAFFLSLLLQTNYISHGHDAAVSLPAYTHTTGC
jgi:hypothetical protein